MKQIFRTIFFLVLLFSQQPISAQNSADSIDWKQQVTLQIDSLLRDTFFNVTQVAVYVHDLDADVPVYAYNHRQLMRPASTEKVITAVAALDKLGVDYTLKTALYYSGSIRGKSLIGDLYCVGGTDPMFGASDMKAFAESVKKAGIDSIQGNVFEDRSMKETALFGSGWCWDDDNPEISPLLFNRKDVFVQRFLQELRQAGVVVKGVTADKRCPNTAKLLCTRSHTIDQVMHRMMKESDNLHAEALFYQIAASTGNRPATARHARSAINQMIHSVGLNPNNYRISDGSGLSLYNYVTAELEALVLRYAYQHRKIYQHLLPTLPIAGVDGTLQNRMKGETTCGKVSAKTGSVTGVFSLAGYCTGANGHRLSFAIINQGVLNKKKARAFQDDVCTILCAPQK